MEIWIASTIITISIIGIWSAIVIVINAFWWK